MTGELPSLLEWFELKDELRTGWVLRGVESPESVAAHAWGVAALCLLYAEPAGVDRETAVTMALLHDLGEARIGDVPMDAPDDESYPSPAEKERTEREAVADLTAPFDDHEELRTRWEEFEAGETPTAAFVGDMDMIDSCLQALAYEREDRYDPDSNLTEYDDLDEFFATAAAEIRTDIGEELFGRIEAAYEAEVGRERQLDP
jgi:putative hydrolase of HD superfamily